jgi:sugar phosphate isomerase/epimerase
MTDTTDGSRATWRYSVSEVTTMHSSFEEDVALYAAAGCAGIGVWGFKMETVGPDRAKDLLGRHGLRAANCIPDGNSILPYVLSPAPADPRERVEAFLPRMERMAKLNPESIVVITGPQGDRSPSEATDLCLEGFERIGRVAGDLGVSVVLEPIHRSVLNVFTLIWDIPGTIEMLRALGQPSFKILFDTWHLWDTPGVLDLVKKHIDLIGGVHVADWRQETRTWADRAFPGEGKLPMLEILNGLESAGFRGLYDVEIFSDNGQFDIAHPDSLWALPPTEIVERATRLLRTTRPET